MRFEVHVIPSKVAKDMSEVRVIYRTDEMKWGQTRLLYDHHIDTEYMLLELKEMKRQIRETVKEYNDTEKAPSQERTNVRR